MNRIPEAEITGFKGALVKRFAKKALGQVPSSLGVYWHNPDVMMGMAGVGGKLKKWDACDEQLKSFAHMAVAAQVGCSWCLDYNYFVAHSKGLDVEKAREVPRWRESDAFTPLERNVMEYAAAMCQTPPAVTDDLSDTLLNELGPAALLELAAKVALMNATARMNISLGIRSEHYADACGLPPLAARSAVSDAA